MPLVEEYVYNIDRLPMNISALQIDCVEDASDFALLTL